MKPTALAVLAASVFSFACAAETSSISGDWKLHSSIQGHESNLTCAFTQTGSELSGSCKSERGSVKITGKVEEKKVTFEYKTMYEGQELTVIHTGTLYGGTKVTGSVDVQPMAVSGEFTATRGAATNP